MMETHERAQHQEKGTYGSPEPTFTPEGWETNGAQKIQVAKGTKKRGSRDPFVLFVPFTSFVARPVSPKGATT